jgi:hypothetical protein
MAFKCPALKNVNRVAALVLLAIIAYMFVWPRLAHYLFRDIPEFFRERSCRQYDPPPNLVVYEEEPAAAKALSGRDGYETVALPKGRSGVAAIYIPRCWKDLNWNVKCSNSVLFLHELPSKSGKSFVWVELHGQDELFLYTRVALPGRPVDSFRTLPFLRRGRGYVRFYAGQIDAADPSHFTIRYTLDGKDGIIHGRMRKGDHWLDFEFPEAAR